MRCTDACFLNSINDRSVLPQQSLGKEAEHRQNMCVCGVVLLCMCVCGVVLSCLGEGTCGKMPALIADKMAVQVLLLVMFHVE